jgi:hypothetical protein
MPVLVDPEVPAAVVLPEVPLAVDVFVEALPVEVLPEVDDDEPTSTPVVSGTP